MSVKAYPTGAARPPFIERISGAVLWVLVAYLAFLGLNIAARGVGIVPEYDALSYVNAALRMYLGLTGGLDPNLRFVWVDLPFTNTLDVIVMALLYGLLDYHYTTWLIHTAYLVLFCVFLRRLYGAGLALTIVALCVTNAYFLHQYTDFISEMKVGMFLALYIAYLFHPEAVRHGRSLFWITLLLLLLRTINLLFVVPLAMTFAALTWLEGRRRGEIVSVLKPVALAVFLLIPLFWYEVPRLMHYVSHAGTRNLQNWLDMSGVHSKLDLFVAYGRGLWEYNRAVQVLMAAGAATTAVLMATRWRRRLVPLRGPALAAALVFGVLMTAATNNSQVVFWLYALEALLAGLWLYAVAPRSAVAVAGIALTAVAFVYDYQGFLALNRQTRAAAPVATLARDLASSMKPIPAPIAYANFGGVGALDVPGLQVQAGRIVGWPAMDQVSYLITLPQYLQALDSSNVAFIANRNFLWPSFVGINRHTEEIRDAFVRDAAQRGWVKSGRIPYDSDPDRYVDVYVRPAATLRLKYAAYGDAWMDLETPVALWSPQDQPLPDGYQLVMSITLPIIGDPAFQPPWHLRLLDAAGTTVHAVTLESGGEHLVRLPFGPAKPGTYRLVFDKSFTSAADPRHLTAFVNSWAFRFKPEAQ